MGDVVADSVLDMLLAPLLWFIGDADLALANLGDEFVDESSLPLRTRGKEEEEGEEEEEDDGEGEDDGGGKAGVAGVGGVFAKAEEEEDGGGGGCKGCGCLIFLKGVTSSFSICERI